MYTQQQLPEADMAYTILSDLKRVTREYATAATESVCPQVRQTFTQLMDDTLKLQGELYYCMQQNNMYNASSPALRQEVDKQLNQYKQTQQKTSQFVQQSRSQPASVSPGAMAQQQQQPSAFQQH